MIVSVLRLLLILGAALIVASGFSCNNHKNNTNRIEERTAEQESSNAETKLMDNSKEYKMHDNTRFSELIIINENEPYNCNIKGKNAVVDIYENLSVDEQNGTTYSIFTCSQNFSKNRIEGLLENNTITIQDDGNADKQLIIFEDCDEKHK